MLSESRDAVYRGCHLFGVDGKQAVTTATVVFWLPARYNVPPTYPRNSSARREYMYKLYGPSVVYTREAPCPCLDLLACVRGFGVRWLAVE